MTLVDGTGGIILGTTTATGNLVVTSTGGAITDIGAATITGVSTLAATSAAGVTADIILDTTTNNFVGAVSSNGANVTLVDGTGGIILANTTATGNLVATSAGGALTNTATAQIAVTGNARLTGTSVSIGINAGADSFNAGTLTFNTLGAVSISEDSSTTVVGANTASVLTLASAGALDNAAGAVITTTGLSTLSGTSINIGNAAGDTFNTGTLTFNSAGAVNIAENSNMLVTGTNTAGTLVLQTPADIDSVLGAAITVTGTTVQLLAGGTIGGLEAGEVAKTTVGGVGYNAFGFINASSADITVQAGGVTNGVSVDIVGTSANGRLSLTPPNVPVGLVLFNGFNVPSAPFVKGMNPDAGYASALAEAGRIGLTGSGSLLPSALTIPADIFMLNAFPTENVSKQITSGSGTVGLLQSIVKLQGIGVNVSPGIASAFQRQQDEEDKRKKAALTTKGS